MNEEYLPDETVQPPPEVKRVKIITDQQGVRHLLVGNATVASDATDQWALMAKYVAQFPARPDTVAWIGGGFCIGPRIARGRVRTRQDVYELRPQLSKFCPNYATFIPGDWTTTLTGLYEVIVYDLDVPPDLPLLTAHLALGGQLFGADS